MPIEPQDHASERSFEDHVEHELRSEFGKDAVTRQHRFDDDGRIADFVVEHPYATFCFELENDAGSVVNGSGQARYYASHFPDGVPVLAIPEGHIDPEERSYIEQTDVIVREYPFEGDTEGV